MRKGASAAISTLYNRSEAPCLVNDEGHECLLTLLHETSHHCHDHGMG